MRKTEVLIACICLFAAGVSAGVCLVDEAPHGWFTWARWPISALAIASGVFTTRGLWLGYELNRMIRELPKPRQRRKGVEQYEYSASTGEY